MLDFIAKKLIQLPTGKALAAAFNYDASICAIGDRDGVIHLIDPNSGEVVQKLRQHHEFVYALAFHENGNLFSVGKDKSIREWDLNTGKMVRDYAGIFSINAVPSASSRGLKAETRSHKMTILSIALGPDNTMATSSQDSTVKFWKNGDPVRTYDWHTGPVTCVRFQPETGILFSASRDKTIRAWNDVNGAVLNRYTGHLGEIVGLEFLDKAHFVSVDALGYVNAYEVGQESPAAFLFQTSCPVVCASLNKGCLLLGRTDGKIEILDVTPSTWGEHHESLALTHGELVHLKEVRCIAARDDQHIVSGDNEGKVIFWTLERA